MAKVGFPWAAESHIREPTYLDEKAGLAAEKQNPPKAPSTDAGDKSNSPAQGKHHSLSVGKRRAGSLNTQALPRTANKGLAENRQGREVATQLQVRTIPRK